MGSRPPLSALFFDDGHGDPDHIGGGTCIKLDLPTAAAQLEELSGQYFTTLCAMAVDRAAGEDDDGWAFGGAAVFVAHHACELALKAALLRLDPSVDIASERFRKHPLQPICAWIETSGGWSAIAPGDRKWLFSFIHHMARVTPDGITIRYADIDKSWCCVSIDALAECVEYVRTLAAAA